MPPCETALKPTAPRAPMRSWRHCLVAAVGLLAALGFGAGCAVLSTRKQREQRVLPADVSPTMVRIAANNFTQRFILTVEKAADAIMNETRDPEIKRRAILWKINATSAILAAQDHPAPLSALADTYVLCIQMRDFFQDGRGGQLFGAQQPVAIAASRQLVMDMEGLRRPPQSEMNQRLDERLLAWAHSHPLDDLAFVRFSGAGEIDAILLKLEGTGILDSVQNLETELYTMHTNLARYVAQVPRQARWQAELLALEAVEQDRTGVLARAGREFDHQRELVVAELDRQRSNVLAGLHQESANLSAFLTQERAAILGEGRQAMTEALERIDALTRRREQEAVASLDQQRRETLDALRQERTATLAEIERIARDTVDHAHSRTWVLMGTAWCGLAGLLLLARFLFPPSLPQGQSPAP